jgi:molybdopterin/thiamine biosynthesis adenylyltransferase
MVSGAVLGDYGQITTIVPGATVSLRKLFATVKDKERPTPVVPTVVFAAGSFMAQEILAGLAGGPRLAGEILVVGMSGFFLERVPVSPE